MNNIYLKRTFAIVLSVMVALAFTAMTTGQAEAKSKKKTVYQTVSVTSTDNYSGKDSVTTTTLTYDKNGLLTKKVMKDENGTVETVYDRAACGAVQESRTSGKDGLSSVSRNKINKKGLVTESRDFQVENDKEKLYSITHYEYHKNGKVSKEVQTFADDPGMKFITTYWKNGNTKTSYTTSSYGTYKYKYNKKGFEKSATYREQDGKGTMKWKYKYDKNDNPKKTVVTDKFTDKKGKKNKIVRTSTYKYKYDKHDNIIKMTMKTKSNQDKTVDKYTETCKYKKFKVDKKYMKYIDSPAI